MSPPIASVLESSQHLDVDENGAPVTFEPSRWLVCFVPGLRGQFWHRFVHKTHKHVLMLKPNPDGTWTLFEPWWTRLLVRTISPAQAVRFLRWAAMGDVLLVEEDVPGRGSQFRGWANCVSLAVFALGRSYCVWSPHALFKRLLSEDRTQKIGVAEFVARYSAAQSERQARERRDLATPHALADLRSAMVDLGRAAFGAPTTPRLVGSHRTAVSEASQFLALASSRYEQGQQDVCVALAEHLGAARDRGELLVDDCQVAANRFLSMLRASPFTQAVIGLGIPPTDREIEAAVTSTVDLFLDGIRPPAAAPTHANDTEPFAQNERQSHARGQSDEDDAQGPDRAGDASYDGLRDHPRLGRAG
ncbi:TetR/AcrR family transcriptional regulator C-terminal domain-containing protein [Phenylobacterium sp. LjRoot225]|uniref:TetR/AcrR family transcriptional regulator C-terminal domain-containing protein n=1 Tax=Phenylobacterium sp. LjRoot225 TaxID=3342285 RepID=UPI003ECEF22D